jgi:predicted ester cyclase
MSNANRQLIHDWFELVWNQKSEAAIDRLFHPQGKAWGFPDPEGYLLGPEGFKTVHRTFCGAFPDLHMDIEDIVFDGDRAAIRWKATMTHTGDHLGFKATGKVGSMTGASFLVTDGSKILDAWNYMDLQAFIQRLLAP